MTPRPGIRFWAAITDKGDVKSVTWTSTGEAPKKNIILAHGTYSWRELALEVPADDQANSSVRSEHSLLNTQKD